MDKAFNDIKLLIEDFNKSLQSHMPALENEVRRLINTKSEEHNIIEHHLDTLLSLTIHGVGDNLFIQLLEYYKNIDAEGTIFYWNEYDKEEEKQ